MTSGANCLLLDPIVERELEQSDSPVLAARNADARAELHDICRSLKDLLIPNPMIFWCDLLLSWSIGALAFLWAANSEWLSWQMAVAFPVAVFAWFRVSIFIHESVHLPQRMLPGFRQTWDVLVGVPLLIPLIFYIGVHSDHHGRSTYGTKEDPEYQFINGRRFWIVASILGSFFIPLTLAFRFLVAAPLGLMFPSLHRVLEKYYSAYSINPFYKRTMTAEQRRQLYRSELLVLSAWGTALILAWQGLIPWYAFILWLAMYTTITFINHSRMLGAHRFDSHWQHTDQLGQVLDSIDTPGAIWTELWAPLGLRYHALHHLLPNLPYHNLGVAYRRIQRERMGGAVFHRATTRGFPWSFIDLWRGRTPAESWKNLQSDERRHPISSS